MSQNATVELNAVTQKRETLEKLVQFAVQITRLLDSMEAVQQIDRPDQISTQKRSEFVNAISSRVQHLSGRELQIRLGKLDDFVKKDLIRILKIADTSESDFNRYIAPISIDSPQNSADWLDKSVLVFKRRSQTDAALRMVLIDQGVPIPSSQLPVSPDAIRNYIAALKQKEVHYRTEVISQVNVLLQDVERFLTNSTFPEDLKKQMVNLKNELSESKQMLQSGKSIESLPMVIQYIDIDNSDPFTFPSSGESIEETNDKTEIKEKTESNEQPVEITLSPNSKTKEATKSNIPASRLGFFQKIRVWLGTPWYIKWKDIEKYHASQLTKKIG